MSGECGGGDGVVAKVSPVMSQPLNCNPAGDGAGPAMEPDRTLSRFGEVRVGVWAGLGEVV